MKMRPPEVVLDAKTREELLTVQEFADRARLNPNSVYRMIKKNRLRGVVKVGNAIRVNASIALSNTPG